MELDLPNDIMGHSIGSWGVFTVVYGISGLFPKLRRKARIITSGIVAAATGIGNETYQYFAEQKSISINTFSDVGYDALGLAIGAIGVYLIERVGSRIRRTISQRNHSSIYKKSFD